MKLRNFFIKHSIAIRLVSFLYEAIIFEGRGFDAFLLEFEMKEENGGWSCHPPESHRKEMLVTTNF